MILASKVDSVFVGVVEIVDHTVHNIRQKQIVVVVEHADVVNYCFGTADLLLLNLNGNEEVLYGQIKDDLERHL